MESEDDRPPQIKLNFETTVSFAQQFYSEVISFNSAISACEKGGQWLQALNILGCGLPFAVLKPSDLWLQYESGMERRTSSFDPRHFDGLGSKHTKTERENYTVIDCD